MCSRMATPNTKIDPAAKQRLSYLKTHVQADFGVPTTHQQIVSALVLGTSIPQLAGTLLGYYKDTAPSEGDRENEEPV
jgi:hypothetical protein